MTHPSIARVAAALHAAGQPAAAAGHAKAVFPTTYAGLLALTGGTAAAVA